MQNIANIFVRGREGLENLSALEVERFRPGICRLTQVISGDALFRRSTPKHVKLYKPWGTECDASRPDARYFAPTWKIPAGGLRVSTKAFIRGYVFSKNWIRKAYRATTKC